MKPVEIRIKRPRTAHKMSTVEILERWAEIDGRSLANLAFHLIETHPQFLAEAKAQREIRERAKRGQNAE